MSSTSSQRAAFAASLFLLCIRLAGANSVKILEVHVELISPSGSALICEQNVADTLRQVTGSCLSECDSLVGFNSASCNTEMGYDVVTLRGGIFGTADDVHASIPCLRDTLAANGCGDQVNLILPSVGALRYIGGIETPPPTFAPQPPAFHDTPNPTISTDAPSLSASIHTLIPTLTPKTSSPAMQPVSFQQPVVTPTPQLNDGVLDETAIPAAEENFEEPADSNRTRYIVLITLASAAAVLLCCLIALIVLMNRDSHDDASISASKVKYASTAPDVTSGEFEAGSSTSSKRRKEQREADARLFGILDRLRDESLMVSDKDELSSDGSSIRDDKFDNASSDFYEVPPGEDETEVTCDEGSEAGDNSEYDFSVSAADFTRTTNDVENGGRSVASVGSLSTNSFSHYFNFDERDMANEEKRRQFLNWLKASKIVPPAAKYSIEASLATTYGPLKDENRPTEVIIAANLADHQDSAGNLV